MPQPDFAPDFPTLVKLGSIIVHAKELISPGGHEFDKTALETLLADPGVKAWLKKMDDAAFLPVMRSGEKP